MDNNGRTIISWVRWTVRLRIREIKVVICPRVSYSKEFVFSVFQVLFFVMFFSPDHPHFILLLFCRLKAQPSSQVSAVSAVHKPHVTSQNLNLFYIVASKKINRYFTFLQNQKHCKHFTYIHTTYNKVHPVTVQTKFLLSSFYMKYVSDGWLSLKKEFNTF